MRVEGPDQSLGMGLERMADGLSRRPVVIIGAGLGGLVTAVALQRVGLTPLVFEKKQHVQRKGDLLPSLPFSSQRRIGHCSWKSGRFSCCSESISIPT